MSDHRLSANGVDVIVRSGWEVEFSELHTVPGAPHRSLVHLANFALPVERGDYGSGAVETMDSGGVLVILMEFDPAAADTAMFSGPAADTAFVEGDFSPQALQRRLPGQAGTQRFFRAANRAFGFYIVLGSHRLASLLVPEVNRTVGNITIS